MQNTSIQSLLDLIQEAPCGFHSLDSDGTFLRINNTELNWLGYRREELVGQRKLVDLLTPEGQRSFQQHFPQLKTAGVLRDLEFDFVRKDGTILPVLVSATAVRDENGKFVMSRSVVYNLANRRQADQRFRSIVEAAPDAIIICAPSGEIILANAQVENVFGYRREELQGKSLDTLLPIRFQNAHAGYRKDFFDHPQTRPMGLLGELYGLRKDGTEVPVEISLSPLRTDGGTLAVATIRDVTARRQAQQEMRESEERFRSMFNAMAEGVVVQEADGSISACNQSAERILGLSRDQIQGRTSLDPLWQAIHEDGSPFPGDLHPSMLALRTGVRQSNVCMGVHKPDGSLSWILITAEPIRDVDATHPHAVVTTFRDITERKKIEEALGKSEERFRVALKGSPTVVFNQDLELRYTWINRPVLAWAQQEWLGKTDVEVLGAEAGGALTAIKQGVLSTGKGTRQEVQFPHDGAVFYYDLTVEPLRDSKGDIAGITCATTDITERKRLEEQLLHSQKMEAIGRLAGGVAHDFNNILGVILGRAELMAELFAGDERAARHAKAIRSSAQQAAALTRQLLAFSRKQVMRLQLLDLNGVVRNLAEMLTRVIGENIEIKLDLEPGLGSTEADLVQIEQVLMNLVVNARDAMPKGGLLTISTRNVDCDREDAAVQPSLRPGQYVMLSVSDTGHGMDASTISRLFEPFFTTKEMGRGTGLGLSIIYGIVQQSDGHISVHSEPGRGSIFKIYLPRLQGLPSDALLNGASSESTFGAVEGGTETILLVEDEEALRDMVLAMLTQSGYTVLSAGSPHEALAVSGNHRGSIDLLLTDVILRSTADGPELSRQILAQRPETRVLFMSGYSEAFIAASSGPLRDAELLEKPFSSEQLHQKIRDILKKK